MAPINSVTKISATAALVVYVGIEGLYAADFDVVAIDCHQRGESATRETE